VNGKGKGLRTGSGVVAGVVGVLVLGLLAASCSSGPALKKGSSHVTTSVAKTEVSKGGKAGTKTREEKRDSLKSERPKKGSGENAEVPVGKVHVDRIVGTSSEAAIESRAQLTQAEVGKDYGLEPGLHFPRLPTCSTFARFPRTVATGETYEGVGPSTMSKAALSGVGESIRFAESSSEAAAIVAEAATKAAVSCVEQDDAGQGRGKAVVRAKVISVSGVSHIAEIEEREGVVSVQAFVFSAGEAVVELAFFSEPGSVPSSFETSLIKDVASKL